MKKTLLISLVLIFAGRLSAAPLQIVTTTTDIADITRQITGDLAEVISLTTGREDPHALTAKPSFIIRARNADVWVRVGMELEIGWEPPILRDSRNARIQVGASHHIDLSSAVLRLDVPTQAVTRNQGDVHPEGNPHYWLDPLNGRQMAGTLAKRLSALYPAHEAAFLANLRRFENTLDSRMFGKELVEALGGEILWKALLAQQLDALLKGKGLSDKLGGWLKTMQPFQGRTIVTYHSSWLYLLGRFGLRHDLQLEPKPGIPPSAKHLLGLVTEMKSRGLCVILQEPFYSKKAAERVASQTGARLLVAANMTKGAPEVPSYLEMLDHVIGQLAKTL
jgi:zinc/manganese transport system substrate-binding protein